MRCRGEDGITLSEMLIAMVISAIIAVPIAGAIFTSLHTSTSTINRTRETAAANLLSSYFGTDVENAVQVGTAATGATESPSVCGASAQAVGLLLTTQPAQSSISYSRGTTPATSMNLYRRTCAAGPGGPSARAVLVMRNVSAAPTFQCLPDCTDSGWRTVTASVTQSDPLNPAFTTTVQASRRVG